MANNAASQSNNIEAQSFSFRELATATNNFRLENLIGEGGFGRVYKGKLDKTGQVKSIYVEQYLILSGVTKKKYLILSYKKKSN